MSARMIAIKDNLGRKQVCNVINKFLSKQPLTRRPGSTTPEQDRKIIIAAKNESMAMIIIIIILIEKIL